MPAKALKIIFMAALAAVPLYFLRAVPWSLSRLAESLYNQTYVVSMENKVRQLMPMGRRLEQIGLDLRLLSGQREQNGIFISEEGLMLNLPQADELIARENSAAIVEFARRLAETSLADGSAGARKSGFAAIIPTAGGVLQQNLPRFAESRMVDQQRLIEELYNQLSGVVRTVDVYSTLQGRRDQYIYYRTENNLTALGGFHVYSAIGLRMEINTRSRSLSQFEIEYADHAYYGDIYQSSPGSTARWGYSTAPYRGVAPDTISLFHYGRSAREYVVTHRGGDEVKAYHTLYPKHLLDTGEKMDVYLGGKTAVVDIQNTSSRSFRLLVFGDKTASAYLPFLCNHFRQVTLVDLSLATSADLAEIRPEQYDQVLFAYGIEEYTHNSNISAGNPARTIREQRDEVP